MYLRRGARNGRRRRRVSCGIGRLELDYPKVRDTQEPFRSAVLDAWQRTSRTLLSTLPSLYIEGLSTRDVERALSPLCQDAPLSRSTVSRANEEIKQAFDRWRRRSLADAEMVYLFLDAHYEGVRLGIKEKEAVLVAHGLVERGLGQPLLVVSDGNPGLIRAVKETWPSVARQRCIVHRVRNVLARVPKKAHKEARKSLNSIFYAASLEEALQAAREFAGRWRNVYPSTAKTLGRDLADCLTFFRFPPRHWRRLRTSNGLERCFKEVKRRTRVIGRFPTEMSALSLIWSVMDRDSRKWRGIVMEEAYWKLVEVGVRSLSEDPIVVRGFEELLAA